LLQVVSPLVELATLLVISKSASVIGTLIVIVELSVTSVTFEALTFAVLVNVYEPAGISFEINAWKTTYFEFA